MAKLNKKQAEALAQLEAGFKACAAAGLVFYGMDRSLLAITKKNEAEIGFNKRFECFANLCGTREQTEWITDIDTSETYQDSGGW